MVYLSGKLRLPKKKKKKYVSIVTWKKPNYYDDECISEEYLI